MPRKPTDTELAAAAAKDATLADLLARAGEWDVRHVKAVILRAALADPDREVSANSIRNVLDPRFHWLVPAAFNAMNNRGGPLVATGRQVASDAPRTNGHGINVYRLRATWLDRLENRSNAA